MDARANTINWDEPIPCWKVTTKTRSNDFSSLAPSLFQIFTLNTYTGPEFAGTIRPSEAGACLWRWKARTVNKLADVKDYVFWCLARRGELR